VGIARARNAELTQLGINGATDAPSMARAVFEVYKEDITQAVWHCMIGGVALGPRMMLA